MNRTIVLLVPVPLSPATAPIRLCGWLAQVLLTSILLSKDASMLKMPRKMPTGRVRFNVSREIGRKDFGVPEETFLNNRRLPSGSDKSPRKVEYDG